LGEDDFIYWQDILDAIEGGKSTSGLKCPFCYEGNILVTKKERGTLVQCDRPKCGHYIEGRFRSEDVADG